MTITPKPLTPIISASKFESKRSDDVVIRGLAEKPSMRPPFVLMCEVMTARGARGRAALAVAFNDWQEEAGFPDVDRVDARLSADGHSMTFIIWYHRPALPQAQAPGPS